MKKLLAVLLLLVVYPAFSQDYTVTPVEVKPPLQNLYETGGTNLNLADDGVATNINIGFDFEFYGNIFDTVNISNNGFITFTGQNSMCCQGNPLPAFGMDNSIMALWTDLISVDGKNPYYKTEGEFGSRYFTVGWYNTLEFYNPEWTNTFEITLYEGSNNILFNYENLNIYSHTITAGIQGTDRQNEQIYYSNNAENLSNTAYLFTYIPPEPETPIAPDCTINPASTSCIINSNTTAPVYVAEETNNTQSETFVAEVFEPQAIGDISPDLESLLASEQKEETVQEEKEEEFRDDISADILQQVLATTETQETNRERNTVRGLIEDREISIDDTSVTDNNIIDIEVNENKENIDEMVELENLVATEQTEIFFEITEETENIELPLFVQNQSESTIENIIIENDVDESLSEEVFVANQVEQAIAIDNEITNEIILTVSQATTDEEIVESILATIQQQQKTFDEDQTDEQLTMAYVQPGVFTSINTYNVEPSMADKEMSGVLGKIEEKSDAEKRAEEVVAANKEQQDEINKNYMDADQSGIVAAMGADTDVNAYRSRMLNDNNIWYKPEDIYKNVIYRDNVRGMYFLEKGSTDTYKQMVDEQYK